MSSQHQSGMNNAMKILYVSVLSLVVATTAAFAGEKKAPDETHGLSAQLLQIHALGEQIPAMAGYQLRARRVTFEPNGATAFHHHEERPGFVYVEKGEITEIRNGEKRTFRAGETWNEPGDTNHWVTNNSDEPAVLIIIDMPPQS